MQKWEYKFYSVSIDRENNHEAFADLGLDGWELAISYEQQSFRVFVFKRPKTAR